uniref:Uncharacterized protein n=1 Tax=Peronospora matthiolae TaxID=2874970 RepID=A0AAV1VEX2_9STRA
MFGLEYPLRTTVVPWLRSERTRDGVSSALEGRLSGMTKRDELSGGVGVRRHEAGARGWAGW